MNTDIYSTLGVKKVIDAWGTVTKIGGSRMDPRVLETMTEASKSFVEMDELHQKAGEHIAKLLEVESCCITCGASAGIAISAAACMTGFNPVNSYQLPDTTGMKDEILILKCHRTLYDQALLLSGAKIKEIGTTSYVFPEQIENAINEKTVAFFYVTEAEGMRGSIQFEKIVEVCNKYNIPIIVDSAAEIPPKSNIRRYLDTGASLVIFSGGKELRGPQSSGLILGKKELIAACDLNSAPNYGIGRPMKIDKENICGIVKAIELFVEKDYELQMKIWEAYVMQLMDGLSKNSNIKLRTGYPDEPGVQPTCILRLYIRPTKMPVDLLHKKLIEGNPRIYTHIYKEEIVLNPQCLEEKELQIVIDAINTITNCLYQNVETGK